MVLQLDHLVVAARTLAEGRRWCVDTLGVVPGAVGQHPLMGTHNHVLDLSAPGWERAYLEVIAIDPEAAAPGRRRWFDLDDPSLQARLAAGPRLVHWVARCADVRAVVAAWGQAGVDRGKVLAAERATPGGLLRWAISVRDDGQRLFDGALPTLIEWQGAHPCDGMPPSGVQIDALSVAGLPLSLAGQLPAGVSHAAAAAPGLSATLRTPRGPVVLSSHGA